jgi:hypothetical protein
LEFIYQESPKGAKKFKAQLLNEINKAAKKPFHSRKSIYFDNENIRDLIFKGHTVTFLAEQNHVVVFGLRYYQKDVIDRRK